MQVTNVSFTNQKRECNCSFKRVYPVYHWYKPKDKYIPATNTTMVRIFQRLLTRILIQGGKYDLAKGGTSSIRTIANYVANNDSDYKFVPYVRSFYDRKGGYKRDWRGEVCDITPSAYLLTGNDAVDFENIYGKPIGRPKNGENYSEEEIQAAIKKAKRAYAINGFEFIKKRCEIDKKSGKPVEIHTVFEKSENEQNPKLVKIGFFQKGSKDNPLRKNGILLW